MTVTPDGTPAWERTASADIYGGHPDKRDFGNLGVINPKTDVSAVQFARLCADMAAVARVAPFSVITLTCDDTSPAAPTVNGLRQMNGVSSTGYVGDSPPAGMPTCTRVSDGKVQIAWPPSVSDEFGISGDVILDHAHASVLGESAYASVVIEKINDYTWTFEAFDVSAEIPDAQMCIEVG